MPVGTAIAGQPATFHGEANGAYRTFDTQVREPAAFRPRHRPDRRPGQRRRDEHVVVGEEGFGAAPPLLASLVLWEAGAQDEPAGRGVLRSCAAPRGCGRRACARPTRCRPSSARETTGQGVARTADWPAARCARPRATRPRPCRPRPPTTCRRADPGPGCGSTPRSAARPAARSRRARGGPRVPTASAHSRRLSSPADRSRTCRTTSRSRDRPARRRARA